MGGARNLFSLYPIFRRMSGEKNYNTSYRYVPRAKPGTTTTLVESMRNGNQEVSYTYDELGNILTISENGTVKAEYQYDKLNQLIRESNPW